MTTMEIPAWAKEFEVVTEDTETTVVNEEFEKLLSESTGGSFIEGEVYKGKVIAIITKGDKVVKDIADHVIHVPDTDEILVPILATIPLQLLSYHIAVMRECNVDQPRNLAKSVTVE